MKRAVSILAAIVSILFVPSSSAVLFSQQAQQWSPVPGPSPSLQDVSALPPRKEFPDCLQMFDGRRVTTREQWERERRAELKILFQHYMYGYMPVPPTNSRGVAYQTDSSFLGGKATRKEVRISFGPFGTPVLLLLLVIPNTRSGPAPVFLGLNFRGNGSIYTFFNEFPFEQIIDRGYAAATIEYNDIFPDRNDFNGGIFPYFRRPGQVEREPHDWGAAAMWAWGLQRAVDYLVTDRDVDGGRIAVTGHSRLGKAALVAAAFDERIGLVIPHQAGTGGSSPSRKTNPRAETVKAITTDSLTGSMRCSRDLTTRLTAFLSISTVWSAWSYLARSSSRTGLRISGRIRRVNSRYSAPPTPSTGSWAWEVWMPARCLLSASSSIALSDTMSGREATRLIHSTGECFSILLTSTSVEGSYRTLERNGACLVTPHRRAGGRRLLSAPDC